MPLYEYQCEPCDHIFETLIRSSGDVAHCPKCSSVDVTKLLSVPATAHNGHGRAGDLPISSGSGFGCGRPQCGQGTCAGLD
jgi:putative FmdB family regulatory protein